MIRIKKYPNRRLYDTSQSKYVNIDYILELIETHQEFEVVDSKSGEDQTKHILLQIISEQETNQSRSVLTNSLLKQLIRFYSGDTQPFVRSYLEQSLSRYMEQQEAVQKVVSNVSKANPLNIFNEMMEQNMKLWDLSVKKDDKAP